MPRKFEMNFDHDSLRWRKMFKGIKYTVYCCDLDIPESQWTEIGSYQKANEWWQKKRLEIEQPGRAEMVRLHSELQTLQAAEADTEDAIHRALHEINPTTFPLPVSPRTGKPIKATIGQALDKWAAVVAVNAKPSSIVMLTCQIREMKEMLGADRPVDSISEKTVGELFGKIEAAGGAPATKRKKFQSFQSFTTWAAEEKFLDLPSNLRSKRYRWRVVPTQKTLPPLDRITTFLDTLPDRLKLYALLAFNTGMNNTDIGHLTESQIDWRKGTLTRKRVKTSDAENVPLVVYGLWAETKRLLKQEITPGAETALRCPKGQPLYVASKANGGKLYDKVKSQWRDTLGRSSERPFTLSDFRDFGSMLLQGDKIFRSYQQAWLGHSPGQVVGRHYSGAEDVTEACRWMEQQIFASAGS